MSIKLALKSYYLKNLFTLFLFTSSSPNGHTTLLFTFLPVQAFKSPRRITSILVPNFLPSGHFIIKFILLPSLEAPYASTTTKYIRSASSLLLLAFDLFVPKYWWFAKAFSLSVYFHLLLLFCLFLLQYTNGRNVYTRFYLFLFFCLCKDCHSNFKSLDFFNISSRLVRIPSKSSLKFSLSWVVFR